MNHSESSLQQSCVRWFRMQHKDGLIYANANGGYRTPIEACRMKGEGVTAGIPDLTVVFNRRIFYVELKSKSGRLSPEQKAMKDRINALGFEVFVIRTITDFVELINSIKCLK